MKEISKKNAEKLGKDVMLWQLQEECGELVKAIAKYNRTRGIGQKTETPKKEAFEKLVVELADVEICVEQLKYLMNINEEVEEAKDKAFKKVSERYK